MTPAPAPAPGTRGSQRYWLMKALEDEMTPEKVDEFIRYMRLVRLYGVAWAPPEPETG